MSEGGGILKVVGEGEGGEIFKFEVQILFLFCTKYSY